MKFFLMIAMIATVGLSFSTQLRADEQLFSRLNVGKILVPQGVEIDTYGLSASRSDVVCLALNDYWEARGESLRGRVAVAQVVLNRIRDPRFPNTICGVISQDLSYGGRACQFSWFCDGRSSRPTDMVAWRSSLKLALAVLRSDGSLIDPTGGALWYHAASVSPAWSVDMDMTVGIDNHVFYRDSDDIAPSSESYEFGEVLLVRASFLGVGIANVVSQLGRPPGSVEQTSALLN